MLHFDVRELRWQVADDLNSFSMSNVLNAALVVYHLRLEFNSEID